MTSYRVQNVDVAGAAWGTEARGINNAGQIAGSYTLGLEFPTSPGGDPRNNPYPVAFIRNPDGSIVSTGPGQPYGQHANGYGINNLGQLVGQSGHYEETARGFVWKTDGTFQRLEYTNDTAFTAAYGNNDWGGSVGQARPFTNSYPTPQPVGVYWRPNGQIKDIYSVPGATETSATGTNNWGWVVGTYSVGNGADPSSTQHGYMGWDSQHIWGIDMPGAVSTEVWDLTNTGEVVGTFQDAGGHNHGFVDIAGHFDQVDIPGAAETFIYGANDLGQVVGAYRTQEDLDNTLSFSTHAFKATPLDHEQSAVDEHYLAAFGREADEGGLNYWAGLLKSGLTPAELARDLAGSPEFHSLHDHQVDRDYVDSVYANGLGRQADAGGESYWVGVLQSGTGRSDVLSAIAQSPEGQQHFAAVGHFG
jgi:hypothetical protein